MKKTLVAFIVLSILVLSLTSCASIMAQQVDDMMKTWLGASKDQLLLKWGPPSSTFPDGKGGEIWTYEGSNQTTGYAYTNNYGQTFYRAPQQYSVTRQFYIDSNGIIYAYRWQGI